MNIGYNDVPFATSAFVIFHRFTLFLFFLSAPANSYTSAIDVTAARLQHDEMLNV